MTIRSQAHAFTRSDLLAVLATLSIAAALALAATRHMRQEAMTASSLSQFRWLAGATSSYAADNNDQFWSFSWKAREWYPFRERMVVQMSDLRAAAYQAIDILDRLAGRYDVPVPPSWIPHVRFNHLPLVDYLGRPLPDFRLVAPGDRHRLNWARDPESFDRGGFLPFQPEPTESAKRWPYSSSYEASVGFWDIGAIDRVYQAATQAHWVVPDRATLGGATLTDVAVPSHKVMLFDTEQRTLGASPAFFADSSARVASLMADGSAGVRHSSDSNLGWHPRRPTSGFPTGTMRFQYLPEAWEPPVGPDGDIVFGRYRWTRGGILGRDFGGPEVDTGQP